jgi:hypothetical protein
VPILSFVNQAKYPWRPLGRLLMEQGLVGDAELEEALAEQQRTGHRLGEILVARGAIAGPDLIRVLAEQSGIDVTIASPAAARPAELDDGEPKPWRPLGTLLMERGVLSEAQLADALHEQLTSDRRLGEILVERGYVTTFDLVAAVVDQQGLERSVEPGDVVSASLSSSPPEVYELEGDDGAGGTTVLFHAGGFLEATDFAFELLESEQRSWLRIVRVRRGEREEVWAYDEERAVETAESKDLLGLYGFDPLRWTGPPS